ncbi:PP2C family protein-serine/threonine phosphatase [Streptomyces californicus]|uniref:PP2C family protein-serine/threonine phosphatase n=1 Tax=Streptomyces californicus TaxID=67351 RepID=UPI0037BB35A7
MARKRSGDRHRSEDAAADPGIASVSRSRIGGWPLAAGIALLTALVVFIDVLTGNDLRLVPLLVVVPALASVYCSLRQTIWVAVWITTVVVGFRAGTDGTFWDFLFGIGFAVLACALGVAACAARIRHATEMARLRSAAVTLQRQILRPLPVTTGHVLAHGLYEPLEEDRFVGGDIYEVVDSPYGTRVIIGDVQGKGLAAIGAGFAAIAAFREAAIRESTLTGVVEALEDAVVRHNAFSAQTGEAERFVTALVLGFDGSGRVEAVNCGHLPPRLFHDGRSTAVPLRRTYVPLGLAGLSRETRTAESFAFPPGATLLVVTDGVTEARDAAGTFYPLDERAAAWARHGPRELLDALHVDLERFSGGVRRDDVAALALCRAPVEAGAPRPVDAVAVTGPAAPDPAPSGSAPPMAMPF